MIPRSISQAIVGDGTFLASDDFDESWRPEVERIVEAFGLRAGVSAPESLFVVPFNRRQVTVVSVLGRRFRFLVLQRTLYNVIPDPFAIIARFPANLDNAGTLPSLEWPEEPLPKRTVESLDGIFKNGDGPFLLGACQTLVDSGRILVVREQPDTKRLHDLWLLLPDSTRRSTWFATFAYSIELQLNLVVLPNIPEDGIPIGYLNEDQTRDYPESRYERELQVAVESGDQRTVDRLFARRTSAETLRLALAIVLGMAFLTIVLRIVMSR